MEELTAPRSRYFNTGLPRTRPDAAGVRRAPHTPSTFKSPAREGAASVNGTNWARRYRAHLRVSDTTIVTLAVGGSVLARFAAEAPQLIGTDAGGRYLLMSAA